MFWPLPLKIVGLGRYLPERIVTNEEVESLCGVHSGWAEHRNGVCERRWAAAHETSSFMGAQAALEALDDAGMQPSDIDLILNASGTPEQTIPDTAPLIQRHLGLGASGISCMSVHTTCLSFLTALDISATLLNMRRYQNILIVSSDIASVGLNFNQPETATLFGDAAAAAVVTLPQNDESSALHAARFETYGEGAYLTTVMGGGTRLHPLNPNTNPEDNQFSMEGPGILKMVRRYSADFLENLQPGLSASLLDIDLVIPHQPSKMGLRLLSRFGWPNHRIMTTLGWLGNCIAASIPVTLYEAVKQERLHRGDKFLMVGSGAGLSLGGLILTY